MIKNIPFNISVTGITLSDEDKEQLSLIYEDASRKMYDILKAYGASMDNVSLNITDSASGSLEEKTVAITSGSQVITPSEGMSGMSKVTVGYVDIDTDTYIGADGINLASGDAVIETTLDTGICEITIGKDSNLTAANIKSGVTIYGVTGTY